MEIYTLTLNPAIDVHAEGKEVVPGKENLYSITSRDAGGKGINIAKALKTYGVDSHNYVILGEDNSSDFTDMLGKLGLEWTSDTVAGRIRENITIHQTGGSETRISFSGFSLMPDEIENILLNIRMMCSPDSVLTVTGSLPVGLSSADMIPMLKEINAVGTKIVIDSKSFSLEDIKDIHPFLIKPNQEEIDAYLETNVIDLDDALDCAAKLRKIADNVIVSLGADGAAIASEEGNFKVTAPKIEAVSTIGAGDSMIAGFLFGYGKVPIYECLKLGVAFGTAACLTPGTEPPVKEDIERILSEIG